jgi:hypothetical protein
MPDLRFDPSKAVTFDLAHGLVHQEGAPPGLLVPADALLALVKAAGPDAVAVFGRSLGEAMGRRVASRFAAASGVAGASVEAVVEHLGGELALAGLGSMGLERWGRAMVIVIDRSPLGGEGDALLGAALEGALGAAAGREVHTALLGRDSVRVRYLIGGAGGVDRVRTWIAEGVSWGEALVRLHGPPAAPENAKETKPEEAAVAREPRGDA